MKPNQFSLLSAITVAGFLSLTGCYTQLATVHEDDDRYSSEQYASDDSTRATQAPADEYDRGFEDGYQRSARWRVGFAYYYPTWSSYWAYDPWYYDAYPYWGGWCGTAYLTYYPHIAYPWYYYSSFHSYYYPNYAYRYGYYPRYSGGGNIYATRNSGSRRAGTNDRRDGGISRGTSSGGGAGYSLPSAGISGGSRAGTITRNGNDGGSRSSTSSVSRGSGTTSRDGGWIYRVPSSRGGNAGAPSSGGISTGRSSGGRSGSSSGGSRNSGGSRSRSDEGYSGRSAPAPSYTPPPARSSSPPPSSSGGGNSGGENRSSGGRRR